jgi:quercetin dioxygenase-like cupin family protein
MSSIQRPLAGDVLVFKLAEEQRTIGQPVAGERESASRTLVKNGPLRVTLVTLAAGGTIKEHKADGPITIQPIHGTLHFSTPDNTYQLTTGDLLALGPAIPHAVASAEGATFLLTIMAPTPQPIA